MGEHEERPRALEGVGQREEAQRAVLGRDVEERVEAVELGGEPAVGQHRAPRDAGRARGVDDGREVVPGRLGEPGVEFGDRVRGRVLREHLGPVADARVRSAVERDDPVEPRQVVPDLCEANQFGLPGEDEPHGAGVVQDVPELVGRAGGVDRHPHGAHRQAGQVGHRPLRAVGREQRHAIARLDAEFDEVGRHATHVGAELGVGAHLPAVTDPDAGGRAGRVSRDHVVDAYGEVVVVHETPRAVGRSGWRPLPVKVPDGPRGEQAGGKGARPGSGRPTERTSTGYGSGGRTLPCPL